MDERSLGFLAAVFALASTAFVALYPGPFERALTHDIDHAACDSTIRIRGFVQHVSHFDDWSLLVVADTNLNATVPKRLLRGTPQKNDFIELSGTLSCRSRDRTLLVREVRQWTSPDR